jgi:PAS domain S-box-containing protein
MKSSSEFERDLFPEQPGRTGRRSEDNEREMLRLLVETLQDYAIFTLDPEGRVLTWNQGAERILGHRAEEIVGQHFSRFFTEADRERGIPDEDLRAATRDGRHQEEGLRVRADGSTFWAQGTTTSLRARDGRTRAYSKIVRDITDRKQAERALKDRAEEVEQLADERARLVLELLDAEERERRRISQALHDEALQNLLAASQDVQEAERGGVPPSEALGRIKAPLERSIQQLRDTSLELHPLLLESRGLTVALDAIATGAATLAGFRASVRVDREVAGINDQLVLSIARELLVNAAKHSQATRVSVTVERRGESVEVRVTDDGVGIPAARREEAWEGGHMGLASLSGRLDAVGGSLELSSGPNSGTIAVAKFPSGADRRST